MLSSIMVETSSSVVFSMIGGDIFSIMELFSPSSSSISISDMDSSLFSTVIECSDEISLSGGVYARLKVNYEKQSKSSD